MVGCIGDGQEEEWRALVFFLFLVAWSGRNHLLLVNVSTTGEMVINLRMRCLQHLFLSRMLMWWSSTSNWASSLPHQHQAVYKKGKKVTFFQCVPHVFSMTAGIGEARIDGRFLVTLVINHQSSLLSFLAHSMTCRVDNEDMDIINKTWILIENTLVVALINCLWMKACMKCF